MMLYASPKVGHLKLELDKSFFRTRQEKALILNVHKTMKKSRYSETQIVSILKKHEAGIKLADICREYGISDATFYNWKAKYGGLDVREVARLKELEAENAKLKKMYADLGLENYALKDLIAKKL
jgi:putative transposase